MPGRLDRLAPYLPPVALAWLRRTAQRLRGLRSGDAAAPGTSFAPEEIERLRETYFHGDPAWEALRDAHMPLPDWFRSGLDPWSEAYREQQLRLWRLIAGVDRDYDPDADEADVYAPDVDPVRRPAYYLRRDAQALVSASDHVLATGMLLRHCGLGPGEHALEYGAGFAQSALALARFGVRVDTVDISPNFCRWVQEQADFFQVPLSPHRGRFGLRPKPWLRYNLIWFYESFHHCWDFDRVVPQLAQMLADGGRIILGGEPVFERENAAVPYPWGVRLHSEVAAVMRQTRWMELGFSEAFLYELFARSGLRGRRIDCEPSLFGTLYVFEREPRQPPQEADAQRWQFGPDGGLHAQVGVVEGGAVVSDGRPGVLCYGPYVPWAAGPAWALVRPAADPPPQGRVFVDVCSSKGEHIHVARWFDLAALAGGPLWLSFELDTPVQDLQVRVVVEHATRVRLEGVGLAATPA